MPRRNPKRQCRSRLGDGSEVSLYGVDPGKGTAAGPVGTVDDDLGSQNPNPLPKQLSRYVYETLEGQDKIRTLKLHSTKERIECTLQQISVSEGGYQALSYVWGNPEQHSYAIVLDENGHELGYIPLTKNLSSALCDLRQVKEITSKIFWIDQICIDQEGKEKNHQVALMGDTYRNAARVITYLGPAASHAEEEKRGIDLLHRLYEHFTDDYDLIYQASSLRQALLKTAEFPVTTLPEEFQEDHFDKGKYVAQGWRWLFQVAYGEWSRRLWIVQEQLLNEEIAMLRGSSLLSWDAVAMIPVLFGLNLIPRKLTNRFASFWQENTGNSIVNLHTIEDSIYSLWHTRKHQQKKTKWLSVGPRLVSNMARYQSQHCCDQRDRVFSLLAISSDATTLGITPDYSASIRRVFHDASIRILQTNSALHILVFACRWGGSKAGSEEQSEDADPTITTSSPSSWELRPPSPSLPASFVYDICTPHPRTSGLGRPPRFLLNSTVLVLKGRFVDRISMTTPVTFLSESTVVGRVDLSWIQCAARRWTRFLRVLQHLGTTVQNAARLASALAANTNWSPTLQGGLSVEESFAFAFLSILRSDFNVVRTQGARVGLDMPGEVPELKQWDTQIQELAAQLSKAIDLGSFHPSTAIQEYKAANELRRVSALHGRSFCATENGRVCNAMNQPEKGDLVAAFEGSDRLFILRPTGERYRLVGDAYVDGLMEGEAYEGLDSDEVDYDIELV
ncbi:heterokaryon incompatibility protein-domain-containing protein [Hyaloscypha finlandica]|nr:heterokaryon incompatibility protein-domain-containing protein [Hyaloscypha finlandica]